MTDDREKEEAEESVTALDTFAGGLTQAIEEPNAAITEVTGIPVGVLDERLDNFAQHTRMLIAQEEKIEIDLNGAPKESKFAQAKRKKERFEADYEPLDVKKLANKAVPVETSTREESNVDSMMLGSNRPMPTPPPPSIGKTTVPETPTALAKARTMPGISEDAVKDEEWAKKTQEYEADLKKKEEAAVAAERRGFSSVALLKESLPPEGVLNPRLVPTQPMLPKIPVRQVVKEERAAAKPAKRRGWGVYVAAAAVVGVVGIAGVVTWASKGTKDVMPSVASAVVISQPPPSATSPSVLQVAERDASEVAEGHNASNAASASTATITMKSEVRSHRPQQRRRVVTAATTVTDAAPVVTEAPVVAPKSKSDIESTNDP